MNRAKDQSSLKAKSTTLSRRLTTINAGFVLKSTNSKMIMSSAANLSQWKFAKMFPRAKLLLLKVSVTRMGEIWMFLSTNYVTKVAQAFYVYLGYFQTNNYLCKTISGQLFRNYWATFHSNIWSHCSQWCSLCVNALMCPITDTKT